MPNPTCPHCHSPHMALIRPYPLRPSYGWEHACQHWALVIQTGCATEAEAARSWAVWCSAARDALEEEQQDA